MWRCPERVTPEAGNLQQLQPRTDLLSVRPGANDSRMVRPYIMTFRMQAHKLLKTGCMMLGWGYGGYQSAIHWHNAIFKSVLNGRRLMSHGQLMIGLRSPDFILWAVQACLEYAAEIHDFLITLYLKNVDFHPPHY